MFSPVVQIELDLENFHVDFVLGYGSFDLCMWFEEYDLIVFIVSLTGSLSFPFLFRSMKNGWLGWLAA